MSTDLAKEHQLPLAAYKVLVDLLRHDEVVFWRRNDILLALNGGLIVILGVFRPPDVPFAESAKLISLTICSVGFIMCLLWVIIIKRGEAFYNHWYVQLMFVEKEHLAPIRIFQNAEEYFDKGEIRLGDKVYKLDPVSRRMRIFRAMLAAPIVFLVAWLGIGVYLLVA